VAEVAEATRHALGLCGGREADILALMQRAHALKNPADWLIRAKHNRKLDRRGQVVEQVGLAEVLVRFSFTCRRARTQGAKLSSNCAA